MCLFYAVWQVECIFGALLLHTAERERETMVVMKLNQKLRTEAKNPEDGENT